MHKDNPENPNALDQPVETVSSDVYEKNLSVKENYETSLNQMDLELQNHHIRRFTIPIPNIQLRNHKEITSMVITSIRQDLDTLLQSLNENLRQSFNGDYIDRAINTLLGRFLEEYLLGQGLRGKERKVEWVGPVHSPLPEMKIAGIELFIRSDKHSLLPEGVCIFGIRENVQIDGQAVFAPHAEKMNAAQFFYRGRPEFLYEILNLIGRPQPVSIAKSRANLDYRATDYDQMYAANPFSFSDQLPSIDTIIYPHPDEWDETNNTMYNAEFLDRSLRAKALMKFHFENISQAKIRITNSIEEQILVNLRRS